MNYTQWRTHADRGQYKRVTWVCGEQRALVADVVATIRAALQPSDLDTVTCHAGQTPDADIWAAAHQYPFDPDAHRLVLVRDAEKISYWEPLPGWLAATRQLPGVYLLFVSGLPDFPHAPGSRTQLAAHLAHMRAPRGHLVRCATPNGRDALAWARRRAPALDEDTAKHLLTRTGGNLTTAAAVLDKIALFGGTVSHAVVDALVDQAPADNLADALVLGDRRAALVAAARTSPADVGAILGLLDSRLDLVAALWHDLRTGELRRERAAGDREQPAFLVAQFAPAAKFYDPGRVAQCRRLLAVLDDAHRTGARTGLLEALIALW